MFFATTVIGQNDDELRLGEKKKIVTHYLDSKVYIKNCVVFKRIPLKLITSLEQIQI